jgi:ubiquinone/menaquinone biosynthesis C-methylase UbiE
MSATTSRIELARGFRDVDASPEPSAFVDYLTSVTPLPAIRENKQFTYALLQPRAGSRLLDIGCGVGDDARELARLAGPTGRVLGIDRSAAMVEEARRRTTDHALPVRFVVQEVSRMKLPPASFDGCRADRVFQHIADPSAALKNIRRALRPGGRLVISEPDWGSLLVDGEDNELGSRILDFYANELANGWIGRQLPRLLSEAGFALDHVSAAVLSFRDLDAAESVLGVKSVAARAHASGVISIEEGNLWIERLERLAARGAFFASVTGIAVCGIQS